MATRASEPPTTVTGVVLADTSGCITSWDGGAEQLFGHRAADAVGATLDLIVPPDHREVHWAGFRRAMATGTCRLDRATTNLPVLCADGEVRLFPGRFVFLADARDVPAGAMAIYAEPVGGEEAWGAVLPVPEDVV
jgi:PAS domain S-box-containing protein